MLGLSLRHAQATPDHSLAYPAVVGLNEAGELQQPASFGVERPFAQRSLGFWLLLGPASAWLLGWFIPETPPTVWASLRPSGRAGQPLIATPKAFELTYRCHARNLLLTMQRCQVPISGILRIGSSVAQEKE